MTATIQIEGNLIADPRPGQGPDGAPVANFAVAVNTSKRQPDGSWLEVGSQVFNVAAWRQLAAAALNNLAKGTPVTVTGRLSFRKFTTQAGVEVTSLEVDAESIGYSLRFHDVQGMKRQGGGSPSGGAGSASSYYGQPQQAPQQPQQQAPSGSPWPSQPQAQQSWGQPAVPQQRSAPASQQQGWDSFDDEQPF